MLLGSWDSSTTTTPRIIIITYQPVTLVMQVPSLKSLEKALNVSLKEKNVQYGNSYRNRYVLGNYHC
jgi:hypothetical protein